MATKAILVVDPDEGMAEFLTQLLEQEDYRVVVAECLRNAVARLSKAHFDLIITEALEQGQPYMFDPAFLSELRLVAYHSPIILCSIYPSTEYIRAPEFGLAEVVNKPFDIDELLRKVGNCYRPNCFRVNRQDCLSTK
ncbi:MAG: response regulator [Chloroflexi bacterium]|nr:response regulator [Chloroflexota bacterium]